MKAFELEITCTMEDGGELVALVDQRDRAAYERSALYAAEQEPSAMVRSRWLAWNALRRMKLLAMSWDEFDLEQCAGAVITAVPEQALTEQEGEQEPDPSRS